MAVKPVLMILGSADSEPGLAARKAARSSAGCSCSVNSRAAEKGMMRPPPCASTQSAIFFSHLFFLRA